MVWNSEVSILKRKTNDITKNERKNHSDIAGIRE